MTAIGDCKKTIETAEGTISYYSLKELESQGIIKDLNNGKEFHGDAVSDLERDIMAAGGIFQYMKQQAAKK